MRAFVLIAASLVLAACSSNPTTTEPVVYSQSEVADSIQIRVGRTIIVDGTRITFEAVESDSRCPMDAICVWQGDAVARFLVEQSAAPSSGLTLKLHTTLDPKNGTAHGFRVELLTLQPYPRAATGTKPEDYIASVKITPAS